MTQATPKSLDDLPVRTVRRLGALAPDQLDGWARQAGHRYAHARLAGCADRKAVLREIGRALALPRWYGANLDALYDCLTDLPEATPLGLVLVLDGLAPRGDFDAAQRDALLDVFRDAQDAFEEAGRALRVLYR